MIALIALLIQVLFLGMNNSEAQQVMVIPAKPDYAPIAFSLEDEIEWAAYWAEANWDYQDEFDRIYNAIEYKVSRNGRSMVKGIHSKGYRFI